jgi:23S rRNA pseudouridine1911/1915/1917 synthase
MPTHPLEPEEKDTLANALVARYPELAMVGDSKLEPGLVHRLDNDTSGLLVVARTQRAYTVLKEEFRQEVLKKEYLALVMGELDKGGKIDSCIGHHPESQKKMEVFKERDQIIKHKAMKALTTYEVEKRYQGYTLVRATIKTGVMHQIRVHLTAQGYPVVGDSVYGNPKRANAIAPKLKVVDVYIVDFVVQL